MYRRAGGVDIDRHDNSGAVPRTIIVPNPVTPVTPTVINIVMAMLTTAVIGIRIGDRRKSIGSPGRECGSYDQFPHDMFELLRPIAGNRPSRKLG